MKPTADFLHLAEKRLRLTLQELRPELLQAYGAIEHQLKGDKSIVTAMDLKVEKHLAEICKELDPGIAFSGEETGTDYSQKTFWLVDPIDGTEPFTRGLPFSTNMITLIHNGQAIMSIIYNFFLDEYYLAIKGEGATCNGHAIKVSNRPLDRSYITISSGFIKAGIIGARDQLRPMVAGIPQMNASGYEFSAIARGAIEAHIAFNPSGKPWDFAPGTLLIQEAGGRVENLDKPGYDFLNPHFVAASPVVFDELMAFVKKLVATKQTSAL